MPKYPQIERSMHVIEIVGIETGVSICTMKLVCSAHDVALEMLARCL
jgi:hypothetical protein